jgi:hypothetical protein
MARSARSDVRWKAAVFVEPDETTVSEDLLHSYAFRRFLLQIGGANIAAARIAPTSSSLADDEACLLAPPQHGEGARSESDCSGAPPGIVLVAEC